jgi:hypothetical protein
MDCFSEALDYLDFNDETVKGIIMQGICKRKRQDPGGDRSGQGASEHA